MSSSARAGSLVLWHISDGRRGHDNQCLGLIQALQQLRDCDCYRFNRLPLAGVLTALIRGRYPVTGTAAPDPDLIIGAGHGVHATMLAARRIRGGRAIVLMRPGLPASWFDLCLIPAHDRPRASPATVVTEGALSRMVPAADRRPDAGLMLIGGPSRHYRWDEDQLLAQLDRIARRSAAARWLISDSPRTPATTRRRLAALQHPNCRFVEHRGQPDAWLQEHLAAAAHAWITEDSVSMIYDALSAGAAVGLLHVPARHSHRLTHIPAQLQARNMVTLYQDWDAGHELARPPLLLNESARCAELLLRRFGL